MSSPSPVGEDSWVDYVDQARRVSHDLEQRVNVIELYKQAVGAEPGSLKTWLAYCEYFWELYTAFRSPDASLPHEEQLMGCEIFSLDNALHLWSEAYGAIKYRLADSHELWNRWISLEMEQLVKTKTPEGVRRITHLYRDRLQVPHMTWEETSQMFSTFLSEYNREMWEQNMQDVTRDAQESKRLLNQRDPFETDLTKSARCKDEETYRTVFRDYLEFEVAQSRRNNDKPEIGVDMCRGLFERGLAGAFALDEATWNEYVIFLSQPHAETPPRSLLQVLQRAVDHCPWSGMLWSRYILYAEEAKLPFSEIESIKHAATSKPELFRHGMSGLIEMYVAWCGFLKRTAMNPSASDEDVDIADVGLPTALEHVNLEGKAHFDNYQGDPECRLERLYIQYLTEKKRDITEARKQWNRLCSKPLHADSYEFWIRYYTWEMMVFASVGNAIRSPTPGTTSSVHRDPSTATSVLARACKRKTLDWPEKLMEVYLQHCNDYERPAVVRHAIGDVHRMSKPLVKRRQKEAADVAAAAAMQYAQSQAQLTDPPESLSVAKRKREDDEIPGEDNDVTSKRAKTRDDTASLKRDREHTSVVVTGLPNEATQTKVKRYFKEFGHINNMALVQESDQQSSTALIEFRTASDATSALLRDGKFFGKSQIGVGSGRNLTLYVTNYPPEADEKFIRDLFKGCGDVLSVRFPSLKFNTHRRFCYVSFKDTSASDKAILKDGKIVQGCKLVAKYSNPGEKKQRESAVADGREIHLSQLPGGSTENDLREMCSKYGGVVSINMPRNLAGKTRGAAYVVFEKRDQAESATVELDKSNFRGCIIEAELAKEKNFKQFSRLTLGGSGPPSPGPTEDGGDEKMEGVHTTKPTPSEIRARTIAISNLPDTVNDARIQAMVQALSVGKMIALTVQPGKGSARVEFENAVAAGRAILQLNGKEVDGQTIDVGGVDELWRGSLTGSEGRRAKDAKTGTFVPCTVRRPGLGRGGKKGLGFVGAKKIPEATDGNGDNGSRAGLSATNADFRTMFLKANNIPNGSSS